MIISIFQWSWKSCCNHKISLWAYIFVSLSYIGLLGHGVDMLNFIEKCKTILLCACNVYFLSSIKWEFQLHRILNILVCVEYSLIGVLIWKSLITVEGLFMSSLAIHKCSFVQCLSLLRSFFLLLIIAILYVLLI